MNGADAPAPFRTAFDNARDPYTARNALGITDVGFISSVTAPLSVTGGTLTLDSSALNTTINCGRLAYSSATALTFTPLNGDRIKINGTVYAIPSGGIAGLANTSVFVAGTGGQNLAASTLYYVYAFINGSTVTADFSATTHGTSATAGNVGVEVKSGDDTRSLIGMIRTNGSSQFQNDVNIRFVVSWFNRRNIGLQGSNTAGVGTGSGTYVELTTGARIHFLTWGEDSVAFNMTGTMQNNTGGNYDVVSFGIDGATNALSTNSFGSLAASTYYHAIGGGGSLTLAEGYHYATPIGLVSGGTGTFLCALAAIVRG